MKYATIESIEEGIGEIKTLIREILIQESFFLRSEDIKFIEKGREDYEFGKVISTKTLRKIIE